MQRRRKYVTVKKTTRFVRFPEFSGGTAITRREIRTSIWNWPGALPTAQWILVVDDDANNLKAASHILVKSGMRASCVRSGEDALRFLNGGERRPDLILLDIHMPGMDGFGTLEKIRAQPVTAAISVVFLTADEDAGSETRGLEAGAKDFIKKPFVPEVLLTRARHIIQLTRLQTYLESQVKEQTAAIIAQQEKLNRLSIQLVMALSGAVDAKDPYTHGHSRRVAEYSAEEYALIEQHPALGCRVLENISEFPELAIGAHWHHERFDGTGYPDHLKGTEIPEKARIIAVADTYDAMTSRRSYRDVLDQSVVRAEIEKGMDAQFDPAFARIMLDLIDEDRDYQMRQM